ncbi:hypothetical protein DPMN_077530, partial [Dreissena polymorpha]
MKIRGQLCGSRVLTKTNMDGRTTTDKQTKDRSQSSTDCSDTISRHQWKTIPFGDYKSMGTSDLGGTFSMGTRM